MSAPEEFPLPPLGTMSRSKGPDTSPVSPAPLFAFVSLPRKLVTG